MGDPKKLRKKYTTPRHPWMKANIEAEKKVTREFGLVKKKEIHIASSFLTKYKDIAKKLIATRVKPQSQKEKAQVLTKLQRLGLLPAGADLDQILGVELKDVLERRLQSIVFRKGMARSIKQARQHIVHRHIQVMGQEISSPSYLVSLEEESTVVFKENSTLADLEHPERVPLQKVKETKEATEKRKESAEAPAEVKA